MTRTEVHPTGRQHRRIACLLASMLAAGAVLRVPSAVAGPNLLQNAGFEEAGDNAASAPHWSTAVGSGDKPQVTDQAFHGGRRALAIPAYTAVEQKVGSAKAGAYVARAWVKSEAEQRITWVVQDSNQPWVGYTCSETKVPSNQWVQIETFCCLDRDGSLTVTLGGVSRDFRLYHGVSGVMGSSITADDVELFRCEPSTGPVTVWEAKQGALDWSQRGQWSQVEAARDFVAGTCVIQSPRLVGAVRKTDGSLQISAIRDDQLRPRCILVPSVPMANARCSLVTPENRKGLRVSSEKGDCSYTAWFTPEGLVRIAADHIPQFQVKECHLRYGLLPSFVGTDICYAPGKMQGGNLFHLPSTQWLVGLVEGNDSMLVAVWESDTQAVSMGLAGEGDDRLIDSLTIDTASAGFSVSSVEHAGIWHREVLKEEWLGDYVPIVWERAFPARWMCQFFVTPATRPTWRQPQMDYSFPIAYAKTRFWGVWFEDWNSYPFYFDGPRLTFHFDKTFVPNGDALIYFLEPAAADLYSPCEIVEQALGRQKAMSLFDFDGNRLRRLSYSTPDDFMYDRPVCATTTRLTRIKQEEKAVVGLNLATHIYEFIREIRNRVDQYGTFFGKIQDYLASEKTAHPEVKYYIEEMEAMVTDALARSKTIYATTLPSVQAKADAIKKRLLEETGDGFQFGDLDCRNTAGSQDDMCRHCNRLVVRLVQTAALRCGDSPQKALIAKHIWDESRAVLRQPTRWESRRTLYFSEP
jgi:hypothetical protein